jgi:hypothetical protein
MEPKASASEGLPSNPAPRPGDRVPIQGRDTTEPVTPASEASPRRASEDTEARPGNEALPTAARPAETQTSGRGATEIPTAANTNASRGTGMPPATRGVPEHADTPSALRSGEPQPGASHAASLREASAPRDAAAVDAIRADIARSPKSAAEIEARYRAVAQAGAEIEAVLAITREIGGRKWKSNAETTLRLTRPPRAPDRVFIPADKLWTALKKLSPLDVMAVEKSRRHSGGYAEIPLEVYAVRLHPRVGDALGPHVKLTPQGLSLQEVIDAAGALDRFAGIATDARPSVGSGEEIATSSRFGSVLDTLRANVSQRKPSRPRAGDGPAQGNRPRAQPMRAAPRAGKRRPAPSRPAPDAKRAAAQKNVAKPRRQIAIRNMKLAGKEHPITKIPFRMSGHAIFDGVAIATVKIRQTGNRSVDFAAADRAMGPTFVRPAGYIWHHHEDRVTMQLVPRWIHEKTGHTGGVANILQE